MLPAYTHPPTLCTFLSLSPSCASSLHSVSPVHLLGLIIECRVENHFQESRIRGQNYLFGLTCQRRVNWDFFFFFFLPDMIFLNSHENCIWVLFYIYNSQVHKYWDNRHNSNIFGSIHHHMDFKWNDKMCFNCRLSALIWGYLHPNQVNGVGITTVCICASHLLRDQK